MSSYDLNSRPLVVSDADRAWAMAKCPPWCRCDDDREQKPDDDIADDGAPLDLEPDERPRGAPLRKARAIGRTGADGTVTFAAADIELGERYAAPHWGAYVDERIREFELANADARCSAEIWSKRWRGWFGVSDPARRFPNSKPLVIPAAGYVFLKPGTALHAVALRFAPTAAAKRVWAVHGAQFEGNAPLLESIRQAHDADLTHKANHFTQPT